MDNKLRAQAGAVSTGCCLLPGWLLLKQVLKLTDAIQVKQPVDWLLKCSCITGIIFMEIAVARADPPDFPGETPSLVPRIEQADLAAMSVDEIVEHGRRIFTTHFTTMDGLGDGPIDRVDPRIFGGRPTLDNNGMFLRVNGLDSQSCNECHSIVSNATRPPLLGIGGVGGVSTNAFFRVTGVDAADSRFNGFAELDNGRFINPPFLFGAGGIELLGKEMTQDLQALKQNAIARPGVWIDLVTKGVNFGAILFDGANFDYSRLDGIDHDLVIRPFGRKGEFATVRGFDVGALQFHLGLQAVELVGEDVDGDGDGVVNEIKEGELSVLHAHNVMLPPPVSLMRSSDAQVGARIFEDIGCGACHIPEMHTESSQLRLAFPEVDTNPESNIYIELDLGKKSVGFQAYKSGGLRVPCFSDLKRHDMGPGLAESAGEPLDNVFVTARLWGVADTSPYLHDGRATTLSEAILFHGGEAQESRDNFDNLDAESRVSVLTFLRSLRTPIEMAQ